VKVSLGQATEIYKHYRSLRGGLQLFDDVLPLLTELRERGIVTAIISNNDRALGPICQELGLDGHIEFGLSSWEIGFEKPDPHIFREALRLAKVSAGEALHVGDQYHSDVVGALAVGIMPLLLDRFGFYADITDCQHIGSLLEVLYYLCM
jgi:HAD superfamily hydrolase (TIGR01549 family)